MKKTVILIASTIIFAGLGYAYYHFVGCNGACAITSSPTMTVIFGGVIGALLGSIVTDGRKENANL
jgi:hypothetical protein